MKATATAAAWRRRRRKFTKNREMEMEAGAFSNKLEENFKFPLTTPYRTGQVFA